MADEELKIILASNQTELKSIKSDMKEIKVMLKSMIEVQQRGSLEMVELKKDLEYAQRDILSAKADFEKQIKEVKEEVEKALAKEVKQIWSHIRRRDKKQMWVQGILAVVVAVPLIQALLTYLTNN